MSVDWGQLTPLLRSDDWTCATHGRIIPATNGVVPACPHCGQMALQVRSGKNNHLQFVEPAPTHCAGAERHPFGPSRVQLGWRACQCPDVLAAGSGGHRTWTCATCRATYTWPPHAETDVTTT